MAHNRLMGFRVVRSTRPVQFTQAKFLPDLAYRTPRALKEVGGDEFFMNTTQKYFFRCEELRHLRIEQFQRYFTIAGDEARMAVNLENTTGDEDDVVLLLLLPLLHLSSSPLAQAETVLSPIGNLHLIKNFLPSSHSPPRC